jgi:hypothetical protein
MTPESEARPFFVIVAFIGTFALSRAGFEAHSSSGSWGGLETELEEVGHLDVGYSKEED